MKLRQQIPKHLYDRGEAAKLGKPDFYVGPTMTKKATPSETPAAVNHDDDLQTRMMEAKANEDEAEDRNRGSLLSSLMHLLRGQFARAAR